MERDAYEPIYAACPTRVPWGLIQDYSQAIHNLHFESLEDASGDGCSMYSGIIVQKDKSRTHSICSVHYVIHYDVPNVHIGSYVPKKDVEILSVINADATPH